MAMTREETRERIELALNGMTDRQLARLLNVVEMQAKGVEAFSIVGGIPVLESEQFSKLDIANQETRRVFEDTDEGKCVIHCSDAKDMFESLGMMPEPAE